MRLDDAATDREADAGAAARRFGGEERIEDAAAHLVGDAGAAVADDDPHLTVAAVVLGADGELPLAAPADHRLLGIGDEVGQHLGQLIRIGHGRGRSAGTSVVTRMPALPRP